jgi:hypothetical protein
VALAEGILVRVFRHPHHPSHPSVPDGCLPWSPINPLCSTVLLAWKPPHFENLPKDCIHARINFRCVAVTRCPIRPVLNGEKYDQVPTHLNFSTARPVLHMPPLYSHAWKCPWNRFSKECIPCIREPTRNWPTVRPDSGPNCPCSTET